jgi:hypothetical protein
MLIAKHLATAWKKMKKKVEAKRVLLFIQHSIVRGGGGGGDKSLC